MKDAANLCTTLAKGLMLFIRAVTMMLGTKHGITLELHWDFLDVQFEICVWSLLCVEMVRW